jgi:hypothetical protein
MEMDFFKSVENYIDRVEFACKEFRKTIALVQNNRIPDIENHQGDKNDVADIFKPDCSAGDDMATLSNLVDGQTNVSDAGIFPENRKMVDMTSSKDGIALSTKHCQNKNCKGAKPGRHYIKNWPKMIFDVLNGGKEKIGKDIFSELHDTGKIHFKGQVQEKNMKFRFKKILQRLEVDGLVEQVSDEYNASWRWIGGAIM